MSRKKKQLHTEKSKDLGNAKQQHEASTVVPGTAKEKDFKESTQGGQKREWGSLGSSESDSFEV